MVQLDVVGGPESGARDTEATTQQTGRTASEKSDLIFSIGAQATEQQHKAELAQIGNMKENSKQIVRLQH